MEGASDNLFSQNLQHLCGSGSSHFTKLSKR